MPRAPRILYIGYNLCWHLGPRVPPSARIPLPTSRPVMPDLTTVEQIRENIRLVRGHDVILQTDLARLYRLPLSRLLTIAQAFPGEFCFFLDDVEVPAPAEFGARPRIAAFTEYGALAVAYAIDTPEALETGLQIVRAFMRRREAGPLHEYSALTFARA
jgi:hypothetical protein